LKTCRIFFKPDRSIKQRSLLFFGGGTTPVSAYTIPATVKNFLGVQKSFPPVEGYDARLFRRRCTTGEKTFCPYGTTPLILLPPSLPALREEKGKMGEG
jgi:hypothetical protein